MYVMYDFFKSKNTNISADFLNCDENLTKFF